MREPTLGLYDRAGAAVSDQARAEDFEKKEKAVNRIAQPCVYLSLSMHWRGQMLERWQLSRWQLAERFNERFNERSARGSSIYPLRW